MGFSDDLKKITAKIEAQMTEVARKSIEEVFAEAQKPRDDGGRMPVVSGTLRGSLSMNGGATDAESFRAAAQGLVLGDTIIGAWTAPYASLIEYGSDRQQGAHFVGVAAMQFSEIVERNARKVRGDG
ncbi:hypothetical protein [Pseudooceanicola sp.]|uniref:hypothetical protein n=1 Tax=Pseudooceanicola sp. TaxID=1914328 RepID=UPI00351326A3